MTALALKSISRIAFAIVTFCAWYSLLPVAGTSLYISILGPDEEFNRFWLPYAIGVGELFCLFLGAHLAVGSLACPNRSSPAVPEIGITAGICFVAATAIRWHFFIPWASTFDPRFPSPSELSWNFILVRLVVCACCFALCGYNSRSTKAKDRS